MQVWSKNVMLIGCVPWKHYQFSVICYQLDGAYVCLDWYCCVSCVLKKFVVRSVLRSFSMLLQTTHVAAQYGQTTFLYHIVTKWNADPDVPDNDGRSPLHWYEPLPLYVISSNLVGLFGHCIILFLLSYSLWLCHASAIFHLMITKTSWADIFQSFFQKLNISSPVIVLSTDPSLLRVCRAAYKGFADSIRLLLFLDAYRGRQDKEGIILF